jgi:hypothetical protein
MALAAWAALQTKGLLAQLSDVDDPARLNDSALHAQTAALYSSCLTLAARGALRSAAALRQFQADMDKTGFIYALAEAVENQIW